MTDGNAPTTGGPKKASPAAALPNKFLVQIASDASGQSAPHKWGEANVPQQYERDKNIGAKFEKEKEDIINARIVEYYITAA